MNTIDSLQAFSPAEFDERYPAEKPAETPKKGRLRPILTMADEIRSRGVEFLWENRFPYQTGILAGTQGLGKSMFTAFLAAMLTRDDVQEWPDGTPCPTGSVLWFSPEGGEALTVRRLKALGANLGRVAFFCGLTDGKIDEDGEPVLRDDPELTQVRQIQEAIDKLAESSGVPVRLVVCDPVADFMGACDQYKAGEVSSVLKKLDKICERNQLCFLLISHLRKSGGDNAVYSVQGSSAFTSKSRFACVLNMHPDHRRAELAGDDSENGQPTKNLVLSVVKSNDFYQPHSLEFELHFNPIGLIVTDCRSRWTADGISAVLAKIHQESRKGGDSDGKSNRGRPQSDDKLEVFSMFSDGKSPADVLGLLDLSKASVYRWHSEWQKQSPSTEEGNPLEKQEE